MKKNKKIFLILLIIVGFIIGYINYIENKKIDETLEAYVKGTYIMRTEQDIDKGINISKSGPYYWGNAHITAYLEKKLILTSSNGTYGREYSNFTLNKQFCESFDDDIRIPKFPIFYLESWFIWIFDEEELMWNINKEQMECLQFVKTLENE